MTGVNGFDANGRGPWRISPECPAPVHNSTRAARGQGGPYRGTQPKCVCPRAQDVYSAWKEARREKERLRMLRVHREKDSRTRLQPLYSEPVSRRSPDFSRGLCATLGGRSIATRGMNDQASHAGIRDRAVAKTFCDSCPMKPECREWVTTQESPPGSWGGVWGGLDPYNRKGLELIIQDGRAKVIPYAG